MVRFEREIPLKGKQYGVISNRFKLYNIVITKHVLLAVAFLKEKFKIISNDFSHLMKPKLIRHYCSIDNGIGYDSF